MSHVTGFLPSRKTGREVSPCQGILSLLPFRKQALEQFCWEQACAERQSRVSRFQPQLINSHH